jgi:hypothetical protein
MHEQIGLLKRFKIIEHIEHIEHTIGDKKSALARIKVFY